MQSRDGWRGNGRIWQGMEIALRSGATPFLLGARLASGWRRIHDGIPAPDGGLATASKVALDEIFFAAELISAPFLGLRDARRVSREMRRAIAFYDERGFLRQPSRYHRTPPPLEIACSGDTGSPFGSYRHLRYESGFEPHPREPGRTRWLSYRANRTAHAWLLQHPGRRRPWLVCIPGYRMGHPAVDFTGFRARWLHRRLGLNVAFPVMPLHGPRRVGRRGGDGFFSGDFLDTLHAQAQAIWDVRRLVRWLREHGAPAVGVYGVSLGGYTTALLAALESEIDCVIAGIPAVDFARLLRAHAPDVVLRAAERAGLRFDDVARLLRVVSPLAIEPRVPRERRFLYAGLSDRLASPDHARDLWEHWERPRVEWYEGGHVSFLWEPKVKTLLEEALHAGGLIERRRVEGVETEPRVALAAGSLAPST